ncbi:hypothetical protein KHC17_25845 (plasmid) [Agrobacterium salinitolerans]|uniref:hypothetical protein n=1 Tax=Agrobacterium salinitolerans TaxID=1183413 RepID=UPI001C24A499|nr:hypothetical protein [Agrobacterium salinitolerans]QXC52615.1 hypothetical protein KHC17_25845 [Agrobacterium salinitolerans]
MKPLDDNGHELRSTFSVAGAYPVFQITFESRNGDGRNPDYGDGVEIVLDRLAGLDATITQARITSDRVLNLVEKDGLDPTFEPAAFPFPLKLGGLDNRKLRLALGRSGARIASKRKTGGNATRRMSLAVALHGQPVGTAELELVLAGRLAVPSLEMMPELSDVDAALGEWLEALRQGSRPDRGNRLWMSEEMVMLKASPSGKRANAFDVQLGVHSTGKPWSVEINAPRAAADPNGLVSVATSTDGRRFVLRQGWLRPNPDSDGEVEGAKFRTLSGLEPVIVTGGVSKIVRSWYVVADIDGSAEEIRRQTGEFVHACARARLLSKGLVLPQTAPPTLASDEKGGVFVKPAKDATPEKEILRLQGEVWLSLRRVVEKAGLYLLKLRHEAGYEVDGIIVGGPSRILVEIKTGASAADIYEGVGQLVLYSRMLDLSDYRRILLLPGKPSATLAHAVEAEGLMISTYKAVMNGKTVHVEFSEELLSQCGLPR